MLNALITRGDYLAEAAQNREAFVAQTYDAYFDYVWRLVRRLGGRERDLEDLVHDVFVAAYHAFERYDAARPVKPWLYGIAFRVVSDYRRKASFQREVAASDREVAGTLKTPLAALETLEMRQQVQDGLEALPDDQRAVFVMHELEELSMPEIADALGTPLNTLYSRLRLARKRFSQRVMQRSLQRGDP